MKSRDKYRLVAAPVYVAGLSLLGTVALAFKSFDGWLQILWEAWLSRASLFFVVGNLGTAWAVASLSHEGRVARGIGVAVGGTTGTFYASSLLLPSTLDPPDSFFFDLDIGGPEWFMVVLAIGAPGILAGIVAPVLWGRWEARRDQADRPARRG